MSQIIKKPITTEKSSDLRARSGVYVFEVAKSATKTSIKNHVERFFDVKVKSVKTLISSKRLKKPRGSRKKLTKYIKKAFVRLKPGQSIQKFEGN